MTSVASPSIVAAAHLSGAHAATAAPQPDDGFAAMFAAMLAPLAMLQPQPLTFAPPTEPTTGSIGSPSASKSAGDAAPLSPFDQDIGSSAGAPVQSPPSNILGGSASVSPAMQSGSAAGFALPPLMMSDASNDLSGLTDFIARASQDVIVQAAAQAQAPTAGQTAASSAPIPQQDADEPVTAPGTSSSPAAMPDLLAALRGSGTTAAPSATSTARPLFDFASLPAASQLQPGSAPTPQGATPLANPSLATKLSGMATAAAVTFAAPQSAKPGVSAAQTSSGSSAAQAATTQDWFVQPSFAPARSFSSSISMPLAQGDATSSFVRPLAMAMASTQILHDLAPSFAQPSDPSPIADPRPQTASDTASPFAWPVSAAAPAAATFVQSVNIPATALTQPSILLASSAAPNIRNDRTVLALQTSNQPTAFVQPSPLSALSGNVQTAGNPLSLQAPLPISQPAAQAPSPGLGDEVPSFTPPAASISTVPSAQAASSISPDVSATLAPPAPSINAPVAAADGDQSAAPRAADKAQPDAPATAAPADLRPAFTNTQEPPSTIRSQLAAPPPDRASPGAVNNGAAPSRPAIPAPDDDASSGAQPLADAKPAQPTRAAQTPAQPESDAAALLRPELAEPDEAPVANPQPLTKAPSATPPEPSAGKQGDIARSDSGTARQMPLPPAATSAPRAITAPAVAEDDANSDAAAAVQESPQSLQPQSPVPANDEAVLKSPLSTATAAAPSRPAQPEAPPQAATPSRTPALAPQQTLDRAIKLAPDVSVQDMPAPSGAQPPAKAAAQSSVKKADDSADDSNVDTAQTSPQPQSPSDAASATTNSTAQSSSQNTDGSQAASPAPDHSTAAAQPATSAQPTQQQVQQPVNAPQAPQAPVVPTALPATALRPDIVSQQLPARAAAPATPSTVDNLAMRIAAKLKDGDHQFDIRLDPPELGRVDVRLSVDSTGRAEAHIVADKQQSLDVLQRDSGTLHKALKDSGLDVSNNSLNFSLKGQDRGDGGASRYPMRAAAPVFQDDATNLPNLPPSVASSAPMARLDIRI